MLRRFAAHLDDSPAGIELEVEDFAKRLGIGERAGPNAPFARTLKRCVDFQMAEWRGGALAVRRHLPPLARRHVRRLPDSLQVRHGELLASELTKRPLEERLRAHGRRLALSLYQYGEDCGAVEQQLIRWAFEPGLAADCAAWATAEQARRAASLKGHPSGLNATPLR